MLLPSRSSYSRPHTTFPILIEYQKLRNWFTFHRKGCHNITKSGPSGQFHNYSLIYRCTSGQRLGSPFEQWRLVLLGLWATVPPAPPLFSPFLSFLSCLSFSLSLFHSCFFFFLLAILNILCPILFFCKVYTWTGFYRILNALKWPKWPRSLSSSCSLLDLQHVIETYYGQKQLCCCLPFQWPCTLYCTSVAIFLETLHVTLLRFVTVTPVLYTLLNLL